jgi:hypothetical protein
MVTEGRSVCLYRREYGMMGTGRSASLHEVNDATFSADWRRNASATETRDTREPMQPPPQLVRWLTEKYPKPTVDEVRVSVSIIL